MRAHAANIRHRSVRISIKERHGEQIFLEILHGILEKWNNKQRSFHEKVFLISAEQKAFHVKKFVFLRGQWAFMFCTWPEIDRGEAWPNQVLSQV